MDGSAAKWGKKISEVHASMMTTRDDLDGMINGEGEDKLVILEKVNSQRHRLHINNKNKFNEIRIYLAAIRREIERLNIGRKEEVERVNKLDSLPTDKDLVWHRKNEGRIREIIDGLIIQLQAIRLYIKNQDDAQVLNNKIVDYMLAARFGYILPKP